MPVMVSIACTQNMKSNALYHIVITSIYYTYMHLKFHMTNLTLLYYRTVLKVCADSVHMSKVCRVLRIAVVVHAHHK